MKTLFTKLVRKERQVQGILELFILDLKRYHILHLKFGTYFQNGSKIQNLLLPLKMLLKNGNQQIVLATYVEHIYFRLALCHYFIIQSKAFSRISFVNILYCKYLYSTQHMVWLRGSFSAIMRQLCHNCVVIESRPRHVFSWELILTFFVICLTFFHFLPFFSCKLGQLTLISPWLFYVFFYTISFIILNLNQIDK